MTDEVTPTSFDDMNLSVPVMKALKDVGYESPSPIQAKTIPLVLAGKDLVGQAQTGTGKTAAFALPLLSRIDLKKKIPQVLVLTPTRELAIQVAEAFQTYAKHIKGFHVLPIYGGQEYGTQLRPLKRGVHVVVGTPGRVMDHMRRGTLKLDELECLVLDEADEMLRMGFIDDVEWVLEQSPDSRQIALFSATMPNEIRKIAKKHLQDPEQVTIKNKTATVDTINQRYWLVSGAHKLDALTRIMEAETTDGVIIFVRTRISTVELAEKLQARGYSAAALNGDLQQKQRERTITQLKSGKLDILIATDVAARGLDVERISHVINYDVPNETEAYIHRIGRTGRAGRTGEAILFVTPREKHWLHRIEKATRQKIAMMELPSTDMINDKRVARFKQNITDAIAREGLDFYQNLIEEYQQEHNIPATEIAAALAKLVQGKEPLLLRPIPASRRERKSRDDRGRNEPRGRDRSRGKEDFKEGRRPPRDKGKQRRAEEGMETYRIEVGHDHDVQPGNIVGAIANEAGLDSKNMGRIDIHDDYSLIDLPEGMPKEVFTDLKKTWVAGQKLNITRVKEAGDKQAPQRKSRSDKPRKPRTKAKDKTKSKARSKGKRKKTG
ncbi:MAG: ATP-dependent helicase [Gammaproteobacteria bacterium]|nr:MAG: ATP-dependent helicase [Gammaproteobacteria bacterium]RKZ72029.1 MAG: ATP-dependent helicase [Gammaproteobacteria bacterium]